MQRLAMSNAPQPPRAFRFHGRSYSALALKPEIPTARWLAKADKWISRSPGFFVGKPVVIDVTGLALTKRKFVRLMTDLKARNIQILGVEGADPSWLDGDMPPLLTTAAAESPPPENAETSAPPPPSLTLPQSPPSMLIEGPVRSGQSILFPFGDVTVVGSVASGAEIVAAGSIHVYGALRGRAIAGAYENSSARIFCRRLEAELLAINGYYSTAEEIEAQLLQKPVQAWLEGDMVRVMTLA
jgi:septum site-determining protein MinC